MLNDLTGQISVEFVIVIGLILVLVLPITGVMGGNMELDKVMSTAKMGCIDASNDLAYNNTGNVIRFNNQTFSNGTITVNVYSKKVLSQNDKNYIHDRMLGYISTALNQPIVNNSVSGRYKYTITVVNNS